MKRLAQSLMRNPLPLQVRVKVIAVWDLPQLLLAALNTVHRRVGRDIVRVTADYASMLRFPKNIQADKAKLAALLRLRRTGRVDGFRGHFI